MTNVTHRLLVSAAAVGLALVSSAVHADPEPSRHAGRAAVYEKLHGASLEAVSTPETIRAMFDRNGNAVVAPTRIWKVLEHGEKVECLSCIPLVSGLLYNANPKTREISAWWLRRRIFGVFGPGQVYSQVVETLADQTAPEFRRMAAANALGEFLTMSGSKHLAAAIRTDPSVQVREAAVKALERMNNQGPNQELSFAMNDDAESVRLAAVRAATRVSVFTDVASIVALVGDESPLVRRAAADSLGAMRVGDAVEGLEVLAQKANEDDPAVRKAAIWALAQIRDVSARDVIADAAENDPDRFVRDAAKTALRRM
ncbi:MAG TPA: HEAT repeat domain-containing protein [Polyangiaceae bacterium]